MSGALINKNLFCKKLNHKLIYQILLAKTYKMNKPGKIKIQLKTQKIILSYLRIWCILSLLFLILCSLCHIMIPDATIISESSILALVTTLIISTLNILSFEEYKNMPVKSYLNMQQSIKRFYLGDINLLCDKIKKYASEDVNWKIIIDEPNNNTLKFKTKANWKSPGEKITITHNNLEDNKNEIIIKSSPCLKIILWDFAKNYENVKKIAQLIEQSQE